MSVFHLETIDSMFDIEKARRQTAGITDFILEKTESSGMHVTVGIMGWLEQKHGNKAHWEDVC